MSYVHCEPNWIDYGVPNCGWRGHGGLSLSDEGNLIPQYSLEAAWKRNIIPKCYGFVEGLVPPEKINEEMGLLRPPGHMRFDQNSETLANRNHLASKNYSDEIIIWSISDRSDRKRIFRHFCTKSFDNGFSLTHNEESTKAFITDDFISELRPVFSNELAVWIRSRAGLFYCKEDVSPVFTKVAQFEENPYLFGDLAVVDLSGRIWSGTSGQEFSRTKACGEYFKCVTHSDHPKIIFAANENCVSHVDLRLEVSTPEQLFKVPAFTNYDNTYKEKKRNPGTIRTPTIMSVHHVPLHSHCVLIMTDNILYLVDQRIPGRPLLTVSHTIPYGSHVFVPGQPVRDEMGDGSVVSLYALDHCVSGLWRTAIYHHHQGMSWSSVLPFSSVGEGSDISKLIQPSSSRCDVNASLNPVRGFSTVEGMQDKKGRYVDVLIRCLDDSSISYQVFRHGDFGGKKSSRMWRKSFDRAQKWEQSCSDPSRSYDSMVQDHLKTSKQSSTILTSVECSLSTGNPKFAWNNQIHPLRRRLARDPVIVPTLPLPNDQAPLSNAVLYVWEKSSRSLPICGFRGSLGCTNAQGVSRLDGYDVANLAQTYSALLSLAILGDDLSRVDRKAVLATIKNLQREDGGFWSQGEGSECDMRFVFCAVAICHMLKDTEAINWSTLGAFIKASINYDGGIGQTPGDESHGGSAYCAVASLSLGSCLWDGSVMNGNDINRLIKWILWKQDKGFHGRSHKEDDSCYAFWMGATLEILNAHPLANQESLRSFLMSAQHQFMGGFCKLVEDGNHSDLLHTYFSIAALSLLREPGFQPINPSLNVSRKSSEYISRCHF